MVDMILRIYIDVGGVEPSVVEKIICLLSIWRKLKVVFDSIEVFMW